MIANPPPFVLFVLCAAGCLAAPLAQAQAPVSNLQPSMAVNLSVCADGALPSRVHALVGREAPRGAYPADGRSLPSAAHGALFSAARTRFGGNEADFALPRLAGRAMVGAGVRPGLPARTLGAAVGSATIELRPENLPAPRGAGRPFSNVQPSLPLTAMIAVEGRYPAQNGEASGTFIGQVAYFAGDLVPDGWLPADGTLMSTTDFPALFSVLGTTYGGDGTQNFALPDLRGRVAVGAGGDVPLGSVFGADTFELTGPHINGAPVSNFQPSLALNPLVATRGLPPGAATCGAEVPVLGEIILFAGAHAPAGWMPAQGQRLNRRDHAELLDVLEAPGDSVALPDLRGRTLVGAGGADYPPGRQVGTGSFVLTTANLPASP